MLNQATAPTLADIVLAELKPFDGRFNTAWRVAATCALTVMIFMIYGIPLVAIGCYLVLFVMKPNQAETMLMAMGICLLVAIMIPILFGLTIISIEYPVARMAVLIASSILFMFLGGASQLGPAGGIIALVIVFILTILGMVPTGEIATRGILYAVLMALVPMGTLIVFNAVVGPSVPKALYRLLARRMHIISQVLQPNTKTDGIYHKPALKDLHEGQENLEKMLLFIGLFHLLPKTTINSLKEIAESSRILLLASAALDQHPQAHDTAKRADLAAYCSNLATQLEQGQIPITGQSRTYTATDVLTIQGSQTSDEGEQKTAILDIPIGPLDTIQDSLAQFPEPLPSPKIDSTLAQKGFFNADAWRNPIYPRYALKTTLAAVICYLIYTAIQWQDIHTALITCYVGALGTTAETLHKLTLRITGCLIGAAIGVASIYFFMPYMTNIGQLMLLVFTVCLLAAWVSTGSELSSYAGVQIGLAFLLTVLVDFGPSVNMSHALYRTMGILLGNIVLYLVFTRIWPISAAAAATSHLQQILDSLTQRYRTEGSLDTAILRADAPNALRIIAQTRTQLGLIKFEPKNIHPEQEKITQLRLLSNQIEDFYLQQSFTKSALSDTQIQQVLANMQSQLAGN